MTLENLQVASQKSNLARRFSFNSINLQKPTWKLSTKNLYLLADTISSSYRSQQQFRRKFCICATDFVISFALLLSFCINSNFIWELFISYESDKICVYVINGCKGFQFAVCFFFYFGKNRNVKRKKVVKMGIRKVEMWIGNERKWLKMSINFIFFSASRYMFFLELI